MNITVSIANISPAEFATAAQADGLSGSVHAALGFGAWGVEPSVVASFGLLEHQADVDAVLGFVRELITKRGETCAFVSVDGAERLLYARSAEVAS